MNLMMMMMMNLMMMMMMMMMMTGVVATQICFIFIPENWGNDPI